MYAWFETMLTAPSELRKDKVTRRVHASVADAETLCLPDGVFSH